MGRFGGWCPKRADFLASDLEFLIGARPSPNFRGFVGITSFFVHPFLPILGPSLWLYCAILRIFMEIDLHFAARRAINSYILHRHATDMHFRAQRQTRRGHRQEFPGSQTRHRHEFAANSNILATTHNNFTPTHTI